MVVVALFILACLMLLVHLSCLRGVLIGRTQILCAYHRRLSSTDNIHEFFVGFEKELVALEASDLKDPIFRLMCRSRKTKKNKATKPSEI